MNVVLYGRVSSDRQDVDLSIAAQLRAIREYATKNVHVIVHEFMDEAESGRTTNRPVFQEMIRSARLKTRPFEAIRVWKHSRFARNRDDSIIYKSLLRRHGVQVVSISVPVEDSPTGKMMEGIIEVLDEFYSDNLAQEVTRGMREATSRWFWVSSQTPYGYRRVKVQDGAKTRSKIEPDPDTHGIVVQMFDMALSGLGCKQIASKLNQRGIPSPKGKCWGRGRVHAVLTNEVYTGTLLWGVNGKLHRNSKLEPTRVEGAFLAIVDRSTFDQVRGLLRSRGPKVVSPRRVSSPYLLSGLLHCGTCGAAMFGHGAKSGQYHYYVCATAHRNGNHLCNAKPIPQANIEGKVLNRIRALILDQDHLTELVRLTNLGLEGSLGAVRERLGALDAHTSTWDTVCSGSTRPWRLASNRWMSGPTDQRSPG